MHAASSKGSTRRQTKLFKIRSTLYLAADIVSPFWFSLLLRIDSVIDDWRSTFHRIPKLIDQTLADKGARRIAACGLTDVAEGTIFDDFDQWKDQHFIPNLRKVPNSLPDLPLPQFRVDLSTTKLPAQPICHTCEVDVLENTRLTFLGAPEKRHCAFALPERLSYATGDYLSISPKNDIGTVEQVIAYFGIKDGTSMQVQSGGLSVVQAGQWLSVKDVLTDCVELHQPAALKVGPAHVYRLHQKLTRSLGYALSCGADSQRWREV